MSSERQCAMRLECCLQVPLVTLQATLLVRVPCAWSPNLMITFCWSLRAA